MCRFRTFGAFGRGGDPPPLKQDGLDFLQARVGGWMSARVGAFVQPPSLHLARSENISPHDASGRRVKSIGFNIISLHSAGKMKKALFFFCMYFTYIYTNRNADVQGFSFSVHLIVSGAHTCQLDLSSS